MDNRVDKMFIIEKKRKTSDYEMVSGFVYLLMISCRLFFEGLY